MKYAVIVAVEGDMQQCKVEIAVPPRQEAGKQLNEAFS